jgi:hypothetical protein
LDETAAVTAATNSGANVPGGSYTTSISVLALAIVFKLAVRDFSSKFVNQVLGLL